MIAGKKGAKERILILLMSVGMIVMLTPAISLGAPPVSHMTLGASGMATQEDTVYYGVDCEGSPLEWLVLDTTSNDGTTPALFLLSRYLLDIVKFSETTPVSNIWGDSNARNWCDEFCSDSFEGRDEAAILLTTKTEAASEDWGPCTLINERVFLLSAGEATNEDYGFLSDSAALDENRVGIVIGDDDPDYWWLRTPHPGNSFSGTLVYPNGMIGLEDVGHFASVRPAFNLDLNSVVFASAAENGKLTMTCNDNVLPVISTTGGSNWKVTVYDAGQTLTIGTVTRDEDEVSINYSSAATGANQYVSAIITDSAGQLVRYGKLIAAGDVADAAGTVSLDLPADFDANGWVLKVFSEQCNADYRTDYAGTLHTVNVPTAPTIAALSAPAPVTDGSALSLTVPAVTANGSPVDAFGWQICAEDSFASPTDYSGTPLDISYNGWYLRYFASNSVGCTCSNTVQISVVPKSSAKDILTFSLPQQTGPATVNTVNHTVNIQVASGTNPASLTPTITVSAGAAVSPASGVSQNFTAPVTYTVTAENGATQLWTATVTVASSASGGGGGSSSSSSSSNITSSRISNSGGSVSSQGITVTFPAGAVESDINVSIKQITETSGMNIPDNSQLLSSILDIVKNQTKDFNRAVTITIAIDKSRIDLDKYDIRICYYDELDKSWVPLENIKLDTGTGKISGDTSHFTKFAVIATAKSQEEKPQELAVPQPARNHPSDITGHWAEDAMVKMMDGGVVSGYPDGTFQPDKTITRAEFTTMLVKALHLETKTGNTFNDSAAHWAKDSISTAVANGIINGYDTGHFGPDDPITREQAGAIISRALRLETAADSLDFSDSQAVSPWGQAGVAAAVKGGFMSGYPDNTFRPQGYTTRAEAAAILAKIK